MHVLMLDMEFIYCKMKNFELELFSCQTSIPSAGFMTSKTFRTYHSEDSLLSSFVYQPKVENSISCSDIKLFIANGFFVTSDGLADFRPKHFGQGLDIKIPQPPTRWRRCLIRNPTKTP